MHQASPQFAPVLGRYQLTLCVGLTDVTLDTDDLAQAQAELAAFAEVHAGDKDCHGGIYDRDARTHVANVWCRPKAQSPEELMHGLVHRLVKSPQGVVFINGGRAVQLGGAK